MTIVGLDLGCGYTKSVCAGGRDVFKSVYGPARERIFSDALALGTPLDRHREVALPAGRFYLGTLAERESAKPRTTLDAATLFDEFAPVLAPSALAWLLEADVDEAALVVGLPIDLYAEHHERLVDTLTGQHLVRVFGRTGDEKRFSITVTRVCVLPQALGAALNLLLDEQGVVADETVFAQKIGVIDVGMHATGFTVAERGEYTERASATAPCGLASAWQGILERLEEKSGVAVGTHRLSEALTEGGIRIHGVRYDLRRIADQAYEDLAARIAAFAEEHWRAEWDLDLVLLAGGGAPLLAPWLAPAVRGEVALAEPEGSDPRLSNACGFFKYGARLWGGAATTTTTTTPSPGDA